MSFRTQMALARRFPRAVRIYLWIWFVMITIAAPAYIPWAATDLATSGTPGVVGTAVVRRCDDSVYSRCYGDFTAANGSVTINDVQIRGADFGHVGDRHTAFGDVANRSVSVPRSGGQIFEDIALSLLMLVLWLMLFGYCIYRPIRRRVRRRQPGGAVGAVRP